MLDTKLLDIAMDNVENDTQYLKEVVDKVVTSYTSHLDEVMKKIYNEVILADNVSTEILEKYFLELSNLIYFISENTEKVGMYDGVSKSKAQEAYNRAYMDSQESLGANGKKPTVAESTALAENATIHESMVNEMYSRAYKIIKAKIDAAQTMVSTLSKVLSRRMAENQFSNVNNNTRQILNEEVSNNTPF